MDKTTNKLCVVDAAAVDEQRKFPRGFNIAAGRSVSPGNKAGGRGGASSRFGAHSRLKPIFKWPKVSGSKKNYKIIILQLLLLFYFKGCRG